MNLASCIKTRIWLLLLLRVASCRTRCSALHSYVVLLHGNEDVSRLKDGTLPHYVYKLSSYHIETGTVLVAQFVEALRYKLEGHGSDSRWWH
jgi:hypothetical protein